jgi:hypothetical protein
MDTVPLDILEPPPLTVSCIPPLLWQCDDRSVCACREVPPAPPAQCAVSISYPSGTPTEAVATVPPGCDAAGAEIALAVALSRLLQKP